MCYLGEEVSVHLSRRKLRSHSLRESLQLLLVLRVENENAVDGTNFKYYSFFRPQLWLITSLPVQRFAFLYSGVVYGWF